MADIRKPVTAVVMFYWHGVDYYRVRWAGGRKALYRRPDLPQTVVNFMTAAQVERTNSPYDGETLTYTKGD